MKKFEYFDVTADIGFYAFGKNLNEAFENAGLAIFIEKTDDDYHLKAIIKGEDINWDKHERDCEIKAITFHQMEVNMSDDVWLKAIVDL